MEVQIPFDELEPLLDERGFKISNGRSGSYTSRIKYFFGGRPNNHVEVGRLIPDKDWDYWIQWDSNVALYKPSKNLVMGVNLNYLPVHPGRFEGCLNLKDLAEDIGIKIIEEQDPIILAEETIKTLERFNTILKRLRNG